MLPTEPKDGIKTELKGRFGVDSHPQLKGRLTEKLAKVLITFADAPNAPVRLPLGSDTVLRIKEKNAQTGLHPACMVADFSVNRLCSVISLGTRPARHGANFP
jgi:hypothetical protein